ncbi:hypothetical protein CDEF62S_04670 [Castellaniella defragrans]
MPRVPTYDAPQVAATELPGARIGSVASPGLFNAGAQGADAALRINAGMAEGVSRLGKSALDIGLALQQRENQTRVDDALNQAVQARTALAGEMSQLRGKNALDRPHGASLVDEYANKYQMALADIEKGFTTDAQKREFHKMSGGLIAPLVSQAMSHLLREGEAYRQDTYKATLVTALDQIGAAPADDEAFGEALQALHATVTSRTLETGGDEAIANAEFRQVADDAFYARYKAWQQIDPAAALASFQRDSSHISPLMRDRIGDDLFQSAAPVLAAHVRPWVSGPGMAPAGDSAQAAEPRGIRNNNPGNIIKTATRWQGETPGDDPRYATFASPEAGIRAMGSNLLTYQDAYGINTVSGIVARWAPATDGNNVGSYIATVSKALGVKPDDTLNLRNPGTLGKLVQSMIRVENGKQPYSDAQIDAGVNAALGKAALPEAPAQGTTARPAWRDPDAQTGISVIDGLPPNQRLRVLQMAREQVGQDQSKIRDDLQARAQDAAAEYMARGTASNPPKESEFIQAYGQVDGVRRYRALQDAATTGAELQRAKTATDADLNSMLVDAKPEPGEGFADRQRYYELLTRAVARTKEDRAKDPVAFALVNEQYGLRPFTAFQNDQAFAQELAARAKAMPRIAGDYNTPPALFAQAEVDEFGKYLGTLQTADKARVLGMVGKIAGAAGVQSISRQLKDTDSTLGVAAMLAGRHAPDMGTDAGLLYLQGKEAIEQKRAKIDESAEYGVKASIYKSIADVYQTPQGRDAAAEAAFGIYAALKANGTDDVGRAVDIATGGLMTFNGRAIAKPYGWTDGQFRDAMRHAAADSVKEAGSGFLAGNAKVSAADLAKSLPGARLQTYGQGTYLILVGSDVVRRPDGAPFVLTVGQP